ncbi:hypothetical protein B7P27_19275 [Bacillus cereus]|nr:hypothetical protein B7P27_19275 [Bacillus cereus]
MRITKKKETPATKQTTFGKQISYKNTKQETLFTSHARIFFGNITKKPLFQWFNRIIIFSKHK